MTNEEIMYKILATLEKEHINLYHDVSKEEVLNHIANIDGINEKSDIQFDLEMLKLFALFKEQHALYKKKYIQLDKEVKYIGKKFYILDKDKWKETSCFGDLKADEMHDRLEPLIGYETQETLNDMIGKMINDGYVYKMLELTDGDKITLTLTNGAKLELHEREKTTEPSYNFKVLNDDILYFKYAKCQEDKGYPFSEFVKDVVREIEDKKIKEYILDLRGNWGGDESIIDPFCELVKEKNLKGAVLIDNGVASSGRLAAVRFKYNFNTPLIGEPTGGPAKAYGNIRVCEVEGKRFCVSQKLVDVSKLVGYEGAIQPDILVEETIEDIQNKKDVVLETAIDYINKQRNTNTTLEDVSK